MIEIIDLKEQNDLNLLRLAGLCQHRIEWNKGTLLESMCHNIIDQVDTEFNRRYKLNQLPLPF